VLAQQLEDYAAHAVDQQLDPLLIATISKRVGKPRLVEATLT